MQILQFRGNSWLSRVIQAQTRSPYSHSALLTADYHLIEAWHGVGVTATPLEDHPHSGGTWVDVFDVRADYDESAVLDFALRQVGKRYDYRAVLRFLSRRDAPDNDRWFCSELVAAAFAAGGLDLLHGRHSHFSPRDIALSPYLHKTQEILL